MQSVLIYNKVEKGRENSRPFVYFKLTRECGNDILIVENLTDASISCEEGYGLTEDYQCKKTIYQDPVLK